MSKEQRNHDPSRRSGNRSTKAKLLGLTGGALLLTAACSPSGNDYDATPRSDRTARTEAPASTTTTTRELTQYEKDSKRRQVAEAYIASPNRNALLASSAQTAGKRIVTAAKSGEIGYFDFYNPDTNKWGRGRGNEGWGQLQHNPNYGGSPHQIAVDVYQNDDGSFDLTKGVQGVRVHVVNKPAVELESPDNPTIFSGQPALKGWVAYGIPVTLAGELDSSVPAHESSESKALDLSADDLRAVDQEVVGLLGQSLAESGV
jgi:hypothetical protein